jgi:hypothetical protein
MAQKRNTIEPSRKKKLPKYRSFRLARAIKPSNIKELPTSKQLLKDSFSLIWKQRRTFLKFFIIYVVCYLALVKGVNNFKLDITDFRDKFDEVLGTGSYASFITLVSIYSSLISSITKASTDIGYFLQTTMLIVFSLSYIWLIRKMHSKRRSVSVKEAFYVGMRPLIPFVIVLLIILFEMLPAGLGAFMLSTVQGANVVSSQGEIMGVAIVMILLMTLSIYLVFGSIFALYIVTLPNAAPLMAIRSSMRLLRIHRWVVLRKVVSFVLILFFGGFFVALPFIQLLPRLAEVAFFIIGSLSFGLAHTYMYKLYRSMIS